MVTRAHQPRCRDGLLAGCQTDDCSCYSEGAVQRPQCVALAAAIEGERNEEDQYSEDDDGHPAHNGPDGGGEPVRHDYLGERDTA